MDDLLSLPKKDIFAKLSIIFFVFLSIWWVYIFFSGDKDSWQNHTFGFIYGGFSLWGAFCGLLTAKLWGGKRSLMGRAIVSLTIGLLLQGFGQYSFWVYNYILKVEVPYPSISDIGYFGTIPFYIYAAYLLAKASGAVISLRSWTSQIHVIVLPFAMLLVSYFLILRNYSFDLSNPLRTFFDYGYPMGQAIYISVAILAYSLSLKTLGGVMRARILFLIFAFFLQFLADYVFIYFHEFYFPASFIDYFYLSAYFVMSFGLLYLRETAFSLRENK